ncbi:hypothetical protein LTR51_002902 [Lithohypha guttulata]|nr:hypothetical protein LTR51_002902 [Lithohypha guttulata]
MAKQDSFTQFAGALRFLRSHERIRLPQVSENSVALLCSLDTIDSSQHAITLLRAMALVRFHRHYLVVKGGFKNMGSCILRDTNQVQRKQRLQAAILDVLVNEAQECYVGEELIKTRKRIKNFLTASRSWSCLHKAFGNGSFALIPRIAASQVERLPSICMGVFIGYLTEKRGEEILPLSRALSSHLTGILEGGECVLADSISSGMYQSWSDVLSEETVVLRCAHSSDR